MALRHASLFLTFSFSATPFRQKEQMMLSEKNMLGSFEGFCSSCRSPFLKFLASPLQASLVKKCSNLQINVFNYCALNFYMMILLIFLRSYDSSTPSWINISDFKHVAIKRNSAVLGI